VSIPVRLAGIIDKLVESQEYSSRSEFVKEAIRAKLQERDLLSTASELNSILRPGEGESEEVPIRAQ
jgi:Arc/MetJ-type ribon-helix-helix transcriptional regulator